LRSGACRRSKRNKRFRSGGTRRVGERKKRKLPRGRSLLLAPVRGVSLEAPEAKAEVEEGEEEEGMPRQVAVVGEARKRLRLYRNDCIYFYGTYSAGVFRTVALKLST
jgi:ribosomal protein S8E